MKLKKVCFLLQSNVAGGAERVMISLANEFIRRKIETYIIIFDENTNFYSIEKKINVYRINVKMTKLKIKEIEKIILKIKPDCVISFLALSNFIGCHICKKNNIPIIISERNDPDKYSFILKQFMNHFYKKANGMVCQSNKVKEICNKKYKNKKIEVIPNPITKDQICNKESIEKKDKIINVGRLVPQKNQKLLINAFSQLPKKFNNYKLYIYGNGILKEQLESQIKDLKLEKRVFICNAEKNIIKKNTDAKLFVLSSNYEGYPNVLIEAMCNGIASISSDFKTGTAKELIINGKNGYLFETNNEKDLINKIIIALEDEKKLKKLSIEGKKIYNNINIDKVSNMWLEFIEKII